MFVYRAIDRYNEASACGRKRPNRPRSVRTKKAIKAVSEKIRRNPDWKQKILPPERIWKDDLKLAAYKRCTGQFLTDNNFKKNRLVKS